MLARLAATVAVVAALPLSAPPSLRAEGRACGSRGSFSQASKEERETQGQRSASGECGGCDGKGPAEGCREQLPPPPRSTRSPIVESVATEVFVSMKISNVAAPRAYYVRQLLLAIAKANALPRTTEEHWGSKMTSAANFKELLQTRTQRAPRKGTRPWWRKETARRTARAAW